MRKTLVFSAFLIIALALASCSATSSLSGPLQGIGGLLPSSTSGSGLTPAPSLPTTTTPPASSGTSAVSPTAVPSQNALSPNNPTYTAIQSVVQRADEEQQQAFTKNDPTIMKDTATSGYYQQMVQTNNQLANGGVSAIKLVKIEWGPITLTNATTAQATTYETWQTTYTDQSTDQSRDQNVYTLVQQQGAWKIQSDVQPNANPHTIPGQQASGAPSGPTPPNPHVLPGQFNVSNNWSGYAATNGSYTGVSGTWIVPQSSGTGSFASGATWVGIGGVQSRDLIQAGTEETNGRPGTVHYDAWIETLPQPSQPVPLAVNPGDSVSVSIAEQGTNQWLVSLKNNTTGQTYSTTVQYASSLSSAEWVVEAPSSGRQIIPLANFGTQQFTVGSAIQNGKSVTIAQSGAQPITMIDYVGNPIATPSALNANGSGFSVSRASTSVAMPSRPRGFGYPSQGFGLPGRSVYSAAGSSQGHGCTSSAQASSN